MTRDHVAIAAAIACGVAVMTAQQTPTTVFTAGQAAQGLAVYQANCASCHLPDLAGRNEAPQLAGANFMNTWRARSTRDLFEFIQSTMPPSGESLGADQYLAVTAYILQANGAQAGTQPFTATAAVPIGSVATGPQSTAQDRGAQRGGPPDQPAGGRGQGGRGIGAPAGRGGAATAAGDHCRRRGEELRAGHRRDAAQPGSRRLADGAP